MILISANKDDCWLEVFDEFGHDGQLTMRVCQAAGAGKGYHWVWLDRDSVQRLAGHLTALTIEACNGVQSQH